MRRAAALRSWIRRRTWPDHAILALAVGIIATDGAGLLIAIQSAAIVWGVWGEPLQLLWRWKTLTDLTALCAVACLLAGWGYAALALLVPLAALSTVYDFGGHGPE